MAEEKHPGGRPPKYKEEYAEQAGKLCLLGAVDKDIADFFKVDESTINRWKVKYPEFCKSLNESKPYSNEKVKVALFQRAVGYEHEDTHISNYQGEITETPITKHYPPDTAAAFIWLKNRDPENWRDKQEIEHSGGIDMTPIKSWSEARNGKGPDQE